jgi:beta-lactamase regulating signal transducer with metallopeptidase domain
MNNLLYYLLQVFAASGLLYGYYHFFLRNNKFHQYNRYYLLAAVVISIFIPFLDIPVYFSQEQTASSSVLQTLTFISYGSDIIISGKSNNITTTEVIYGIYILFVLLALLKMAVSLIKIWKLSRNNPVEKIDNIFFVNTGEPGTPFSFFRWLFWDKKIDLDTDKGQQIFRHELFHIRQKHSFDTIIIELVTILFWINPFFHLIKKELKAIHEFLADQSAVNENEEWDYAELLLMQVLQTKHSLVNPFFHNQIKRRIAMITSSKKPSYQYLRKMMVLPLLAVVATLFAFTYKKINEPEKQLIPELPFQTTTDTIPGKKTVKPAIEIRKVDNPKPIEVKSVNLLTSTTNSPLYVIDGVIKISPEDKEVLNKLDPKTIQSITVLKDKSATVKYGDIAINGVIEIVTRKHLTLDLMEVSVKDTAKPVIEEVVVAGYATKRDNSYVLKEDNAKKAEGLDLKEVVVNGYASKKVQGLELMEVVVSDKKAGVEEVVAPAFRGGEDAWRRYLQKQLNAAVPVDNGAPAGVYKVVVQFLVDMDGSISDIKAKTNYGYGMEQEVIRILKIGPKWTPGTLEGKTIKTYKQQPVTFVIEDEKDSKLDEVVVVGYPTKKNDAENNKVIQGQVTKEDKSFPDAVKNIDEAGSIYPNPATNLVQIPLSSKVAGAGLVQVVNAAGNIVSTQRPAISKGANTISVNTTSLQPGSYIIKLTTADGSGRSYKMIKK